MGSDDTSLPNAPAGRPCMLRMLATLIVGALIFCCANACSSGGAQSARSTSTTTTEASSNDEASEGGETSSSSSSSSAADDNAIPGALIAFAPCTRHFREHCDGVDVESARAVIECLRAHRAELDRSCLATLEPGDNPMPPRPRPQSGRPGGAPGGGGGPRAGTSGSPF